ncbi:nucleotidyltransferase domain-containing protein [Natroniella acetigena]|uniref:type VII toxin-antitoxin system MntA family adenylyltransferase antitoxin n=1 Tax=Natroniella acetigena TaxID=52004 RepID=UPI002009EF14|nr:nucleotidyltransferase domain-containing protein [Natroniella acetigena]MCK8828004.1 nucleotidyltransferase domain-containing protein [Natroniella acetigena]
MGLEEAKLQELKEIFKSYSNLKATYLFGSYAIDQENDSSDLDFGILLDQDYNKQIKLDILTKLAEKGYCDIDLVLLNEADILTSYEVVKHNQIIYNRDDFDPNSYFSLSVRRYLDFKPFLKVQREYLKEQIING